jgi:glycosyltransferase involved in cell wall biosynthesis
MGRSAVTPAPEARGALHVIHGHGGGTEHHARALIDASRGQWRHHLAVAVGDRWQVEAHAADGAVRTYEFARDADESWPAFLGGLCATFGVDLLHLHNITGCRDGIAAALPAIGLPYGYTVHDFNFACPTILFLGADGMYCGARTDAAFCMRCLAAQPAFASIDIEAWRARHRALVAGASFVLAPAAWTARTFAKYFPEPRADVIPHGAPGAWAMQTEGREDDDARTPTVHRDALPLPDDGLPTVAVLGAVGPDKGARRLERLVALVRGGAARLRFVLIGYMDVQHGPWQSEDAVLTVHGRYDPRDLPSLLARYRARLVAYPSAGPETFSFTLSEAWAAGVPVVVPPFGALADRVAGTGAGWVWTHDEWRDESRMLGRIAAIVAPEDGAALAAAAERARAVPQPTLDAMARRTLAHYAEAIASAPVRTAGFTSFDATRVQAAAGLAPVDAPTAPVAGAEPPRPRSVLVRALRRIFAGPAP